MTHSKDIELTKNLIEQIELLINEVETIQPVNNNEFDLINYKTELIECSRALGKSSNDFTLAFKPPLSSDSKETIVSSLTTNLTQLTSKITQLPSNKGANLIQFHRNQLKKILKNSLKLIIGFGELNKFNLAKKSLEDSMKQLSLNNPVKETYLQLNEALWNSILQLQKLPFTNAEAVLIKFGQVALQLQDVLDELEDLEMESVVPEDDNLEVLTLQPSGSLSSQHIEWGQKIKNYLNLIQKLYKKIELRVIKPFSKDGDVQYLDNCLEKVEGLNGEIDNLVSLIWEDESIEDIKSQLKQVIELNETVNEFIKVQLTEEHLQWMGLYDQQLQKIKDQL